MCGICGVFRPGEKGEVDPGLLKRMADTLRHRGPDGEGYYTAPGIGLGHRRLAIIDLEKGRQPMANEDGSLQVVFNGEIYNFRELRKDLLGRGHSFRTECDTEVLLHLFEERGPEMVESLRGMFSFALWDEGRRRLFLARDRLGQKPLFYCFRGGTLLFASEIKALLASGEVPREVDPEALSLFLTFGYIPAPWTIFRAVRKLPPAHSLLVKRGHSRLRRYWDLRFGEKVAGGMGECRERLMDLFREATRLRLMSDVPLGAFLSGGIDSSATVGVMSRLLEDPVKTFSIGFGEGGYDEVSYARIAAEAFGTEHREFLVRPDALEILPRLVYHFDEPFGDSSALPTYYVSKVTREHVTVALSGDAGDECLGGYDRYKAVKLGRLYERVLPVVRRGINEGILSRLRPSQEQKTLVRRLRRFVEPMDLPYVPRYAHWVAVFTNPQKGRLLNPDFAKSLGGFDAYDLFHWTAAECDSDDFLDRIFYCDIRNYLPYDILVKVDVTSMANSLESRSPFLDHRLLEFAAGLPSDWKVRGLTGKYIFKRAVADWMPKAILRRRKMGFGVPISRWFKGELRGLVHDLLLDGRMRERGYFRDGEVERLVREHMEGGVDHGQRIWSLLNLELWHRIFMDGDPRPDFSL